MRRVAFNLVRHSAPYRASSAPYRASSSDEWECIGGLQPLEGSSTSQEAPHPLFTDAQVDSALHLMQTNPLHALERADFEVFGKRLSWVKLADGCIHRLSTDLLHLERVQDVKERADLLRSRLEARRAVGNRRTPTKTQTAIGDLYAASIAVYDLQTLSGGNLVRDVDGALGRLSVIMRRWRAVQSLAPHATPRTDDLVRMVKSAVDIVLASNVTESTKAQARRLWSQWCPAARPAARSAPAFPPSRPTSWPTPRPALLLDSRQGTKVEFDSDAYDSD